MYLDENSPRLRPFHHPANDNQLRLMEKEQRRREMIRHKRIKVEEEQDEEEDEGAEAVIPN